jgi:maleate isomerase
VDRLEATLGKPVVTTNQVTLWGALRTIGWAVPVPGWGRLLRTRL